MALGGGFLKPGIRWQTLVTSDPLLVPEETRSCPHFSCIIAESADLMTLFATSTAKILHRPSIYLFPRSCQVLFFALWLLRSSCLYQISATTCLCCSTIYIRVPDIHFCIRLHLLSLHVTTESSMYKSPTFCQEA